MYIKTWLVDLPLSDEVLGINVNLKISKSSGKAWNLKFI